MGQVCNKDGYYRQLWFFYGKHKDEQPKNILYWKPTNGQIAPEKLARMIIPATIPKQLHSVGTWAPVERYAEEVFGERKRNDDLKTERGRWNSRRGTEQKKIEAEASKKELRKRKGLKETPDSEDAQAHIEAKPKVVRPKTEVPISESSTTTQPAPEDDATHVEGMDCTDEELKWDNAAIERAWNAFRSPYSDFMYAKMGEILQKRFDTAIAVPRELQERMRRYGKCTAMYDKELVFTCPSWCTWKGRNGATSSPAKEEEDNKQVTRPGRRSIFENFTSGIARCELLIKEEEERKKGKDAAERGGSA